MPHIVVIPDDGDPVTVPLVDKFTTIGRAPGTTVVIQDGAASRKHCMIKAGPSSHVLVDLGSANGTQVNGERVRKEIDLTHDDRIQIGKTVLVFKER